MPPFGYRKRERSLSPPPASASKRQAPASKRAKPTLFETADAPTKKQKSVQDNKKFLEELSEDDEASLSEVDSDDFEDVPPTKRRKTAPVDEDEDEHEEEDDEMDWEDAIEPGSSSRATPATSKPEQEIGDISISMNEDGSYVEPLVASSTVVKKGPSKRERQIRVQTHCLHVQALMWHNSVRNSWLNDKEIQRTLVDGLTEGVTREIDRWRNAMGMKSLGELNARKQQLATKNKGKRGGKGKEKSTGRDWTDSAEFLEAGVPNISGGDPLLRLLKVLTAYWRKRFTVTAPGLRKQGYKPLRRLRDEIKAWENDRKDVEEHGERIESVQDLRKLAGKCEGSRDVGAQLFVALLRGLGLEVRMVANLQPAGFGWSKNEGADEKKVRTKTEKAKQDESESEEETLPKPPKATKPDAKKAVQKIAKDKKPARRSSRGNKSDPIDLDSDSSLSDVPSEDEVQDDDGDDDISVIDITPSTPKKKPAKNYDRDLAFPIYWAEVCSPLNHKFYPVDPVVLSTIASNDDLLQSFEPRGKRAEKSKQVMCYTVAFSSDGTAKDVTIRYLKRHQMPGKTKGVRMPVEKMPVYNRNGKVKKYEDYDWFRTVMSLYDRPDSKRTAVDDLEDQSDLKPYKPVKEEKQVTKESLQGYKQSADFVLELHLRRDEAILPKARPVKTFTAGKGDNAKEHPVYNRKDVVTCKTVESWHKEGREIKVGQQPMKYVPVRAVTLVRKREMEDVERETGEKAKQGLYSEAQTDWIIPPPIKNGIIPRNAFGNIDVYVPTMVPKGAVHLPLKGSAKICKKLEISFAEACTGFEFGKQRAVPVLTGVVVAQENVGMVKDAWRADREEQRRKEDVKRTATSLHLWRKMLLGLRVLERMRIEYADAGGTEEEVNPFVLKAKREGRSGVGATQTQGEGDQGGGFLPPGYDDEDIIRSDGDIDEDHNDDVGGGFLTEEGDGEDIGGGGFLPEEGDGGDIPGGGFLVDDHIDVDEAAPTLPKHCAPITPVSLQSMHKDLDEEIDSEEDDEPPTKTSARSTGNRKQRQRTKSAPKSVKSKSERKNLVLIDDEDEVSSLSNADGDGAASALTPPSDSENMQPPRRRARASPQVIIRRPKGGRAAKKATPVRSRYFEHADSFSEEDDADGSGSDSKSESAEEVVKPRKTTARTRTKT